MTRARKYNRNKPRIALLSAPFICEMGAVASFGENKYTVADESGTDNWRKGLPVRELIDAALRHTFLALSGEDADKESGLSHLAHAAVNLMMASETIIMRPEYDDRFRCIFAMPMIATEKDEI